jgi:mannose-6-phosphate isomerase-like protein (cupin superfamily)
MQTLGTAMTETTDRRQMQIFRSANAQTLMQSGVMHVHPFTATQRAGMDKLIAAGYLEGDETKLLINLPGFSLVHVRFKKDYPLLRHSHDADCLYYVVAGSLKLGTETLGPGDGFFIPAGAPYTYRPGPQGVEVLEFRHATQFDFRNLSENEAFYTKGVETVAANREAWRQAKSPGTDSQSVSE